MDEQVEAAMRAVMDAMDVALGDPSPEHLEAVSEALGEYSFQRGWVAWQQARQESEQRKAGQQHVGDA